jgi:hypothetical protein
MVLDKIEAKQREDEATLVPNGMTLVDLADAVVRGKVKLSPQQMRLLIELLPYHLPKLSAVAVGHFNGQDDFAARLDRAIQRSLAGKPIKLIEAQTIEVDEN